MTTLQLRHTKHSGWYLYSPATWKNRYRWVCLSSFMERTLCCSVLSGVVCLMVLCSVCCPLCVAVTQSVTPAPLLTYLEYAMMSSTSPGTQALPSLIPACHWRSLFSHINKLWKKVWFSHTCATAYSFTCYFSIPYTLPIYWSCSHAKLDKVSTSWSKWHTHTDSYTHGMCHRGGSEATSCGFELHSWIWSDHVMLRLGELENLKCAPVHEARRDNLF